MISRNLGKCDGGYWCCGGDYLCGQGEGDCDNDNECLPGLKCDFDGWWGRDYCKAGNLLMLNQIKVEALGIL